MRRAHLVASVLVLLVACGSSASDPPDAAIAADAGVDGAGPVPPSLDGGEDASDASIDPCVGATSACPSAPAGFGEGSGLVAIDRCAFGIAQGPSRATYTARIDALAKIATPATVADVMTDPNRIATTVATVPGAPPGLGYAFQWNDEDEASPRWFPQGITGSPDATPSGEVGGKKIIVVSFYDNGTGSYEKGARVAFVDVTAPASPKYRFVLLVEPVGTAAAPEIAPVKVHAGGIAWIGDRLYVVETGKGLRVFDLSRLLKVATDVDEIHCTSAVCHGGLYEYVLPQIDAFSTTSACAPIFSFLSLDRSTTPPSLVSGEYCSTTACAGPLAGRVFRWPLDAGGAFTPGVSFPSEAFLMGQKQVQGAASRSGSFLLSSSAPAGGGGALYRVTKGASATSTWADSPEDLMIDTPGARVWSLSEGVGARFVFAADLASYPPP